MNLEIKEKFCRPGDERTVLSYCFRNIDYFYDMTSKITEMDFLYDDHQMLFMMMKNLVDQGVNSIDIAMVINQAQSSGVLEELGGAGYILSIGNIEASKDNFSKYLSNVIEASVKYRAYVTLSHHMSTLVSNAHEGKSSEDMICSIEADILDMTTKSNRNNTDPINLMDALDAFIEERRHSVIAMTGISSGFPILDRQIDGLIPGTLLVIAARKKMGKSTFLTNIGLHVAYILKKPTLYIDTELTFTEWRTRALARISGLKERDIKRGGYNNEQYKKLEHAKKMIGSGNMFHMYMPGYSVDKVVALCKKYRLKEKVGLIVFDYLKEPDLSTTDGSRKEHQLLGDITTKLKDLAGILDVPVLTAVQLNRANDIADSDRIARYGDIIAMWGPRTDKERDQGGKEAGNYKLVIKDTRRGGSTGEEGIGYWFFKEQLHIKEVNAHSQYFMNDQNEVSNYGDADGERFEKEVGSEEFI